MSKTPRVLIHNFLDASRTQSIKVDRRGHEGLVRTPEIVEENTGKLEHSHSKFPLPRTQSNNDGAASRKSRTPNVQMLSASRSRPQHDRVSSLRGKRRSLSNHETQETPRQLFEAFMEEQNTTAPLVRYSSRLSHGPQSASQPAIPVTRRASSGRGGNLTVGMNADTPRTLFQQFLVNASDVVETPGGRGDGSFRSPHSSPGIQDVVNQTYNTPSPFKTGSSDSDRLSDVTRTRRKTPRSGHRHGNFSITGVIAESMYQTEGESIVIPPTNPQDYQEPSFLHSSSDEEEDSLPESQPSKYEHRRKANFRVDVPSPMKEEILMYQQSQSKQREHTVSVNKEGEDYAGTRAVSEEDSDVDEVEENTQGSSRHQEASGTWLLPAGNQYTLPLKTNDDDDDDDGNSRGMEYRRENSHRSDSTRLHVSSSSLEVSPVISDMGNQYLSLSQQQVIDRRYKRDWGKMGRWSEGHRSRLRSSSESERSGHLSEGHIRSFQGQVEIDRFFSPRHEGQAAKEYQKEPDRSKNRSLSKLSHRELDASSRSSRAMDSVAMEMDEMDSEEEVLYAQKLSQVHKDHLHTLPNMSSNFSPKVTSTQVNRSTVVDGGPNNVDIYSDILPTDPSPAKSVMSRPRSLSPAGSRAGSLSSAGSRSGSLTSAGSRLKESSTSLGGILTPSQKENRASMIAPSNSRSTAFTASLVTPENKSQRSRTSSSQGHGSHNMSPLQTVTPSPVVSSGSSSGGLSSSLDLQPSTRKSFSGRQPLTPERSGDKSHLSSARSSRRQSSSRKSNVMDTEETRVASPIIASRKLARDMANTLPSNTITFSPPLASTQNMEGISPPSPQTSNEIDNDEPSPDSHHEEESEDSEHEMEVDDEPVASTSNQQQVQAAAKPAKKPRKPRKKSNYSIPTNIVKKRFSHFAGLRVSKDAIEEVMQVSEIYWDNLAKDLEAYALHAGRKLVTMDDFELLFRRQGFVTDKVSLKSLIEKYLPMEEREKLIPVARAGNRLEPKL